MEDKKLLVLLNADNYFQHCIYAIEIYLSISTADNADMNQIVTMKKKLIN